jgi:hypothetical protein
MQGETMRKVMDGFMTGSRKVIRLPGEQHFLTSMA